MNSQRKRGLTFYSDKPKSKIVTIPPNVLVRADRVIR